MLHNKTVELLGAASGVATIVTFGLSFAIPGFLPPLARLMDPATVAIFFTDNAASIRAGMIMMMLADTP